MLECLYAAELSHQHFYLLICEDLYFIIYLCVDMYT